MSKVKVTGNENVKIIFSCIYSFLADRTNGRAYATVLRPSVVCRRRRRLWRYVLWLNGASYQNEWPWPRLFILVPIDFSYTTSYRLSIVTFALGLKYV